MCRFGVVRAAIGGPTAVNRRLRDRGSPRLRVGKKNHLQVEGRPRKDRNLGAATPQLRQAIRRVDNGERQADIVDNSNTRIESRFPSRHVRSASTRPRAPGARVWR
jgi:hypothetical protein